MSSKKVNDPAEGKIKVKKGQDAVARVFSKKLQSGRGTSVDEAPMTKKMSTVIKEATKGTAGIRVSDWKDPTTPATPMPKATDFWQEMMLDPMFRTIAANAGDDKFVRPPKIEPMPFDASASTPGNPKLDIDGTSIGSAPSELEIGLARVRKRVKQNIFSRTFDRLRTLTKRIKVPKKKHENQPYIDPSVIKVRVTKSKSKPPPSRSKRKAELKIGKIETKSGVMRDLIEPIKTIVVDQWPPVQEEQEFSALGDPSKQADGSEMPDVPPSIYAEMDRARSKILKNVRNGCLTQRRQLECGDADDSYVYLPRTRVSLETMGLRLQHMGDPSVDRKGETIGEPPAELENLVKRARPRILARIFSCIRERFRRAANSIANGIRRMSRHGNKAFQM